MIFNRTKEMPKYEDAEISSELKDIKGSVIMIVEHLLNNINFYTETIEELEKENEQLKQFINELAEIVSSDREDLLVHMEAYLSSQNLQE
mgnify:CR=1 FL=1